MLGKDKNIDSAVRILWDYMILHHTVVRCDAMILLGNRDERTALRAASLYARGFAPTIVISGGISSKNDNLRGYKQTEADHFADIMQGNGVPSHAIFLERYAQNTGENIILSHNLLCANAQNVRSILLIQKPYMERRTYAAFMKQWPNANLLEKVIVSSPPISIDEWFSQNNDFSADVSVIVGDVQRMKVYAERGYQISQDTPKKVEEAMIFLISRGFNKHILQH